MQAVCFKEAKAGNCIEIEKIVTQYYKVAYKIAHNWARSGLIDESEALSLANIAIMKCIRNGSYDPGRETKFTSYLGSAVHNEIRMHLRKERRRRKRISFSFDEVLETDNVKGEEPLFYGDALIDTLSLEEQLQDKFLLEEAVTALKDAKPNMKPVELKCFLLHLQGLNVREISEEVEFSQSYTRKILYSAQDKIKDCIKEGTGEDCRHFTGEKAN